MNWKRKSNWSGLTIGAGTMAAVVLASSGLFGPRIANAAAGKGLDIEIAYEIKALKIAGATSPVYVQADNGKLIFSDASGAVMSAPLEGGTATTLAKVANPAGVAIAPAGFGSYTGQVFVASGSDEKSPCEIMRIGGSSATSFAKLPDAGKLNGGKATQCHDLEFGIAGSPFAGKLYAVANGNATIYEIDSSGKAKAFATFDGTPSYEISSLSFTAPNDPKAPNSMLAGMRPRLAMSGKIGRIDIFAADGKEKNQYAVGFVNPTGWGYAPAGFGGGYAGNLFIVDAGKSAFKNDAERDGAVYRVDEKGVTRPFATGLVDPNCFRIVGNTMVIADPSEQGKPGKGAIVVISSML
jgi:hypothetical protein